MKPHTTLAGFQAGRVHADDLSQCGVAAVADRYAPEDFPAGRAPAGAIYPGELVIEDWQHAPIDGRRWYLQIANTEWLADDLAELEEHLFDYYLSEYGEHDAHDDRH